MSIAYTPDPFNKSDVFNERLQKPDALIAIYWRLAGWHRRL